MSGRSRNIGAQDGGGRSSVSRRSFSPDPEAPPAHHLRIGVGTALVDGRAHRRYVPPQQYPLQRLKLLRLLLHKLLLHLLELRLLLDRCLLQLLLLLLPPRRPPRLLFLLALNPLHLLLQGQPGRLHWLAVKPALRRSVVLQSQRVTGAEAGRRAGAQVGGSSARQSD